MFRTFLVVAAVTVAVFSIPATGADEPGKSIKVGEPFKAELTAKSARYGYYYTTELPVVLKQGQDVTIKCDAPGPKRTVYLILNDETGAQLGQSTEGMEFSELKVARVNVTGEYKVRVYTHLIGPVELLVTATPDDELDERALEAKLTRLKKEVERTEAKLKAIRDKKKK